MWGFDVPPTVLTTAWLLAGTVGVPIGQQALVGASPSEKASILHFLPHLCCPLWPEGVDRERWHEGSPEWGASKQLMGPHEALDAASVLRGQESGPPLAYPTHPGLCTTPADPKQASPPLGPQVVLSVRWGLCRPQGSMGLKGGWPQLAAAWSGIWVPWRGIEPEPRRWAHRILATRPPETGG